MARPSKRHPLAIHFDRLNPDLRLVVDAAFFGEDLEEINRRAYKLSFETFPSASHYARLRQERSRRRAFFLRATRSRENAKFPRDAIFL